MNKKLEKYVRIRKHFFWDVSLEKLNTSAILERILIYGDIDDIRELIHTI